MHQVTSDWHPAVSEESGLAQDTAKQKLEAKLDTFMLKKVAQTTRGSKIHFDKRYESNVEHIKALDHALQGGVGLSLQAFMATRRPLPLTKDQERYFVKAADLPGSLARDGGWQARSCIHDKGSGKRFLETVWDESRCVLFETLDCGTIGWANKFWLYSEGGLRGAFLADPCHLRYNRFKMAVKSAGLWYAWLEGSVLIGLRKGPWAGAAHMKTIQAVASNLFKTSDSKDPIFRLCYEYIIHDLYKGKPPPDAHTEQHMQHVWEWLPQCPLWHHKGARQKASRWFQWLKEAQSMGQYFGCLLMVVLRVAVEKSWYKTLEDTPLCRVDAHELEEPGDEQEEPAAHDGHEELARDDPGLAEDAVKDKRSRTKCTMHLSANIMCNRTQLKLMKMIYIVGEASHTAHNLQVTSAKTQAGCLEWFSQQATGAWLAIAKQEVECMFNEALLLEIGFQPSDQPMQEDDPMLKEEMLLASTMLAFVTDLVAYEIQEGRLLSEMPPYCFGGLVSHDEAEQKATLQHCSKLWGALGQVEAALLRDTSPPMLAAYVRDLVWPRQVWAREVMVCMAENSFQSIPKACRDEIMAFARAIKSSKVVEDSFNELRDCERIHKSNKLGRISRWHKVMASGLLEDADRCQAVPSDSDKLSASKVLPAPLFEAAQVSCSLGVERLETEFKGLQTWASPKPDYFHLCSEAMHTLLEIGSDYSKLERTCMALLSETRTLLFRAGDVAGTMGLVLAQSCHGVLVWRCTGIRRGGLKAFSMRSASECPWQQLTITDPEAWKVMSVEALPPAVAAARWPLEVAAKCQGEIILVSAGEATTLVRAAALKAFQNFTFGQLKGFAAMMKVKVPTIGRPKSEYDWCRLLVQWALPELGPEACQKVVEEHRGCKPPQVWGTQLTGAAADLVDRVLDKEDVKDVRAAVAQASSSSSSGSKGPAAKKARAASRLKQVTFKHEFTREEAAAYLPQVKGCSLGWDLKRHMRWVASYPNPSSPFSCSSVWNAEVSSRDACLKVIRWAWSCHLKQTGEACPYDLQ